MGIQIIKETIFKAEFRGMRKRFFTERAAYNWLAARMIDNKPRTQCECIQSDCDADGYCGLDCGKHEHNDKLRKRLAQYLRYVAHHQDHPSG